MRDLWPTYPKGDGDPPLGYVHGDVLRNSNFFTPNPFLAFTRRPERTTEKIISFHSPHLRLASDVDSLSYLTKNLFFERRKLMHFLFYDIKPLK